MENAGYQKQFVELLKQTVPAHISLAEEVSEVLKISADSAYRRLRGETDLSLDEVMQLARHFQISMDSLWSMQPGAVTFQVHPFTGAMDGFAVYLESLHRDLQLLLKADSSHVTYAAEDLPVFYSLFFPSLARFKVGYWNKSTLNVQSLQSLCIEDIPIPEHWFVLMREIAESFVHLNTTEIWNEDSLKSTIRQVRYYWEAGFIREKETALAVCSDLVKIIELLRSQCENGYKRSPGSGQQTTTTYELYTCDLMIGSNCVIIQAGEREASYIGYNSFNYMRTLNSWFNTQEKAWMQNLIAKSTLISKVAEKQRFQFFKELLKQTEQLRADIVAV
ncbi:MAG: hypothetical protein JNL57_02440 [Bacteroidetes bacterium]|nr:hypothetical protein [Bacteroidota bacterium]